MRIRQRSVAETETQGDKCAVLDIRAQRIASIILEPVVARRVVSQAQVDAQLTPYAQIPVQLRAPGFNAVVERPAEVVTDDTPLVSRRGYPALERLTW